MAVQPFRARRVWRRSFAVAKEVSDRTSHPIAGSHEPIAFARFRSSRAINP
jgi:hypothetical protein